MCGAIRRALRNRGIARTVPTQRHNADIISRSPPTHPTWPLITQLIAVIAAVEQGAPLNDTVFPNITVQTVSQFISTNYVNSYLGHQRSKLLIIGLLLQTPFNIANSNIFVHVVFIYLFIYQTN